MNIDGFTVVATETTLREDVLDNRKRRNIMGDRGGKKGKETSPIPVPPVAQSTS
jgi:hypothetical protein